MNFISAYYFTVLLLFIHMTFFKSLWKCELAELFRIPCSFGRLLFCYLCYNAVFVSKVFVLLHLDSQTLWLYNLSFDLSSKWLLNLQLIPSSQNDNVKMIMLIVEIKCMVFGNLWTLTTSWYNLWYALRWCCFYQCVFTGKEIL